VTRKVALLVIYQSRKVLGGKAWLRANIHSQSNLDLGQLVGVSQISWLLSIIIDWVKNVYKKTRDNRKYYERIEELLWDAQ
jgi:hypothetical protein